MTLKRKIMISNIVIICVPVIFVMILWSAYINTHSGMYLNPFKDSSDNNGSVYNMQYTLYLYESSLENLDFEKEFETNDSDPDILYPVQIRKMQELSEMGFRLQIVSSGDILFSNMDDDDIKCLGEHPAKYLDSKESIDYFGDNMVIRDQIDRNGITYFITAIYNEQRVNIGMQESLLPVYLIAPQLLIGFILIASASVIMANFFLTRWLNHSILKPLDILISGAKDISDGNLDTKIEYKQNDEFGVVCQEFDNMRIKLKSSNDERIRYEEIRRNLMIGISHDLRSPLTSIKGYTEGLKDGIADTDEKKDRYYNAILTRTIDMERLLESMSTLVRLDNPGYHYHFEAITMDEFLRRFIHEEEAFAEQNNITFSYCSHVSTAEVYMDIKEMRRVLVNLLENSVKYRTKNDSVICLDVSENKNCKAVEIRFTDDGPGVQKEQLERIFDSFYRGDASRTKPENGSGLGLAVVKSIVEGHGGKVSAYNDTGLCIFISLPLYEESNEI